MNDEQLRDLRVLFKDIWRNGLDSAEDYDSRQLQDDLERMWDELVDFVEDL